MMLYSTPRLSIFRPDLDELALLHERLSGVADRARPWLERLGRKGRAAAARSAAGVEGYRVSPAVAEAVVEGRAPASGRAEGVVVGYALAMQHVAVLAADPSFGWSTRLLLDLHFEACSREPRASPGRWRTGPVWMTAPEGGAVYQAPPAEEVPVGMASLVAWLSEGDLEAPVVVRAAMAHLNLVSIHPFADGNGRLAGVLQSLVLARGAVSGPEVGTVQERFARDPGRYYAVLRDVLGRTHQPRRSAAPWVGFCVEAHLLLARERLALLERAVQRWSALEEVVVARGLPQRLTVALEQSLSEGVDRSSYASETGVASATASADLRRVLDAGLVVRVGQARHTHYLASDALRRLAMDGGTIP